MAGGFGFWPTGPRPSEVIAAGSRIHDRLTHFAACAAHRPVLHGGLACSASPLIPFGAPVSGFCRRQGGRRHRYLPRAWWGNGPRLLPAASNDPLVLGYRISGEWPGAWVSGRPTPGRCTLPRTSWRHGAPRCRSIPLWPDLAFIPYPPNVRTSEACPPIPPDTRLNPSRRRST